MFILHLSSPIRGHKCCCPQSTEDIVHEAILTTDTNIMHLYQRENEPLLICTGRKAWLFSEPGQVASSVQVTTVLCCAPGLVHLLALVLQICGQQGQPPTTFCSPLLCCPQFFPSLHFSDCCVLKYQDTPLPNGKGHPAACKDQQWHRNFVGCIQVSTITYSKKFAWRCCRTTTSSPVRLGCRKGCTLLTNL